jgi:hypothetical protein
MRTLHFVDKNDKAALVNDKNDNTNGVLEQNLPPPSQLFPFPIHPYILIKTHRQSIG